MRENHFTSVLNWSKKQARYKPTFIIVLLLVSSFCLVVFYFIALLPQPMLHYHLLVQFKRVAMAKQTEI